MSIIVSFCFACKKYILYIYIYYIYTYYCVSKIIYLLKLILLAISDYHLSLMIHQIYMISSYYCHIVITFYLFVL